MADQTLHRFERQAGAIDSVTWRDQHGCLGIERFYPASHQTELSTRLNGGVQIWKLAHGETWIEIKAR